MSAAAKRKSKARSSSDNSVPKGRGGLKVVGQGGHSDGSDVSSHIVNSNGMNIGQLVSLALEKNVGHICQSDSGSLDLEVGTAAVMLQQPEEYCLSPLSAILDPLNMGKKREQELADVVISFSKASEKSAALTKVESFLGELGPMQTLIADVNLICDEFFTNAVFNAPFTDKKTGMNAEIDRSKHETKMGRGKSAELMLGHTDERLAIVCRDPYGSLDVRKLLNRIRNCWEGGISANMKMGIGGAGIGTFMVFNACSSLYVAVLKNRCTVIGASLHWKWSARKRSDASKNLHWFER